MSLLNSTTVTTPLENSCVCAVGPRYCGGRPGRRGLQQGCKAAASAVGLCQALQSCAVATRGKIQAFVDLQQPGSYSVLPEQERLKVLLPALLIQAQKVFQTKEQQTLCKATAASSTLQVLQLLHAEDGGGEG